MIIVNKPSLNIISTTQKVNQNTSYDRSKLSTKHIRLKKNIKLISLKFIKLLTC